VLGPAAGAREDGVMRKAAKCLAALSAVLMLALPGAASATSSNAHRGIGGAYGFYKGLKNGPSFGSVAKPKSEASKQPYPYRYYYDTSRGNYGCNRYARRAIETDNANWWARYRACTEVGPD
jgi:hypothetical protein